MTELAAVVLAHADPPQVRRLIAALDELPVFLHCDARTAPPVYDRMVHGLPRRVTLCERVPASLGSWSLVQAELNGLQEALASTGARHIAVLSGSDYPLVSVDVLLDELRPWDGRSYFRNLPLPFPQWNHRRRPDGGRWRFEHRFITRGDSVVHVRGMPLRSPLRRAVPGELALRASSQWKIYARRHARLLLEVVNRRPDLVRFWRSTYIPDESFAASVLGSPALAGSDALPPCRAHAWHMSWDKRARHPRLLGAADFAALAEARRQPPPDPDAVMNANSTAPLPHRRLFARKFSTSVDPEVLDAIDRELRR